MREARALFPIQIWNPRDELDGEPGSRAKSAVNVNVIVLLGSIELCRRICIETRGSIWQVDMPIVDATYLLELLELGFSGVGLGQSACYQTWFLLNPGSELGKSPVNYDIRGRSTCATTPV